MLQSVPRIEVFNVSDGNSSHEGNVEDTGVFHITTSAIKIYSVLSAEIILSQRDEVQPTILSYSNICPETSFWSYKT